MNAITPHPSLEPRMFPVTIPAVVNGELVTSPLRELSALGQSVWLAGLSRGVLLSGQLRCLMEADGVSGASSDFDAMHEAVRNGSTYDSAIRAAPHDASADDIYRSLPSRMRKPRRICCAPCTTAPMDATASSASRFPLILPTTCLEPSGKYGRCGRASIARMSS